jgi:hypothetical protein
MLGNSEDECGEGGKEGMVVHGGEGGVGGAERGEGAEESRFCAGEHYCCWDCECMRRKEQNCDWVWVGCGARTGRECVWEVEGKGLGKFGAGGVGGEEVGDGNLEGCIADLFFWGENWMGKGFGWERTYLDTTALEDTEDSISPEVYERFRHPTTVKTCMCSDMLSTSGLAT